MVQLQVSPYYGRIERSLLFAYSCGTLARMMIDLGNARAEAGVGEPVRSETQTLWDTWSSSMLLC
eukprot:SAG22_NODE_3173_length_1880_cov_1.692308_3_plen_65_part_00